MKSESVDEGYLESLRKAWQKRAREEKEDMEELRRNALIKATAAADYLKKKYKVSAVYLYGSLAWGRHFSRRSDIDLFVEGISDKINYWKMLAELELITSPHPINAVLSEDAAPSLREKARKEGILL